MIALGDLEYFDAEPYILLGWQKDAARGTMTLEYVKETVFAHEVLKALGWQTPAANRAEVVALARVLVIQGVTLDQIRAEVATWPREDTATVEGK